MDWLIFAHWPHPCPRLRACNRDVLCETGHSIDRDTLAERSKAVAQGAIPKGRGFEPHRCHFAYPSRLVSLTFAHMCQSIRDCNMTAAAAKASHCSVPAADAYLDRALMKDLISLGVWRGSAAPDPIPRCWKFESRCPRSLMASIRVTSESFCACQSAQHCSTERGTLDEKGAPGFEPGASNH